jgi:hypothetical protein
VTDKITVFVNFHNGLISGVCIDEVIPEADPEIDPEIDPETSSG